MVKNLPANARDIRDGGSTFGSGRSPEGQHGNPLQYSCLENPMDCLPGGLQSMGSPRVIHKRGDLACGTGMHPLVQRHKLALPCISFPITGLASTWGTPEQGCQNPRTWNTSVACSLAQPHLEHTSHLKQYIHTRAHTHNPQNTGSSSKSCPLMLSFLFLRFFFSCGPFLRSLLNFLQYCLFYVLTF